MSMSLMAHIWQHSPQRGNKLLLLLALADLADDQGVSSSTDAGLAKKLRTTVPQIKRLVTELEDENAIVIRKTPYEANQYAILSPWIK
jgi:hypothetical protein